MQLIVSVYFLFLLAFPEHSTALNNGLALTPPMGWLSWERYACDVDCTEYPNACISEKLVIQQAEAIVNKHMNLRGYEYVIIDDCWLAASRDDVTGELVPDKKRFPNGMPYLVNYIHSLGLKFGIYQDVGSKTCAGYPGSSGHEQQDADTFAKWEVDYVKMDGCNIDLSDMGASYQLMGEALNLTKRPIVYSCSWPFYVWNGGLQMNYTLLMNTCNLWRNYYDISDSWDSIVSIIKFYALNQSWLAPLAGPGHWNDPDMILVGDFSLSLSQSQVQFGMWCMFSAPLLLSVDLTTIGTDAFNIINNRDVIAIGQDTKGQQARMVFNSSDGFWFVFKKELSDSSFAVAVLYLSGLGFPKDYQLDFNLIDKSHSSFIVEDLYENSVGSYSNGITVSVNPHGIKLLKLTPQQE